jgi:hypothetical protein
MRRALQVIVAVMALATAASERAAALEVTCIEASRYRHLYQLFGGDPKQLAAFLELDPARLPRPEFCRAVLVSGRVEPRSANDADKLLAAIEANQGWLATLQLSSGGGIVQTGYQLGFITRLFWLKTHTATAFGRNLNYTPDFFVPPAAPGPAAADEQQPDAQRIANWRSYLTTQKGLGQVALRYVGCTSACGLIHTAGVDRAGEVRVHRARVGGAGKGQFINLKKTMSETDKQLQRLELEQIAFYRQMDPGPDFVRHYQETPAQTTTTVDVARFPRYVADYLTGKCRVNGDQLQALDRQIGNTILELAAPQFGYRIKTDNLRRSLRQLRNMRADAERCIAAAHESERRSHFAKLCPNGCDRRRLMGMVADSVRGLMKQAQ